MKRLWERLYERLFGESITPRTREFFGHLSWSAFGGFAAGFLMFIVQIAAGRALGPHDFGRVSLAYSLAAILATVFVFGFDLAITRTLARHTDSRNRAAYLTSALLIVVVSLSLASVILLLKKSSLASLLQTHPEIILAAALIVVAAGIRNVVDGAVRGLHHFSAQAVGRFLEPVAIGICLLIGAIVWPGYVSFWTYAVAIALALLVSSAYYLFILREYFVTHGKLGTYAYRLFRYGKYAMVGSLLSLLISQGDKLFVNTQLHEAAVGIYAAYFFSSIAVVNQLSVMTVNVLFPMFSRQTDAARIQKKLDRLLIISFVPSLLGLLLFMFAALSLFGREYPLDATLLILFSLWGFFYYFATLYGALVNSNSRHAFRQNIARQLLRMVGLVVYFGLLMRVGMLTLPSIVFGLSLNYALDIFMVRSILARTYSSSSFAEQTR